MNLDTRARSAANGIRTAVAETQPSIDAMARLPRQQRTRILATVALGVACLIALAALLASFHVIGGVGRISPTGPGHSNKHPSSYEQRSPGGFTAVNTNPANGVGSVGSRTHSQQAPV